MSFQVCTEITCPSSCKITLIAFVGLYPSVGLHVQAQIESPGEFIITLAALVHHYNVYWKDKEEGETNSQIVKKHCLRFEGVGVQKS